MQPTLLCLHGWGGSKESFTELREALKDAPIHILTPDLPGFGDEQDPPHAWTMDDYADWVEERIKKEKITGPLYVLGHSHGGKTALKLAVRAHLPVEHLYLCAAAGIRHPQHIKRIAGLILAKTGKVFLSIPGFKHLKPVAKKTLYRLFRVHDYEKANPVMRETLIRVTQEDLRPLLSFVHVPTDIFWGTEDTYTPVSDAYVMQRGIKDSKLHVFQGVRHRVHRDKAAEIAAVIISNL
jgi:pimeloyl-ACP methyl ester carboxylesterase